MSEGNGTSNGVGVREKLALTLNNFALSEKMGELKLRALQHMVSHLSQLTINAGGQPDPDPDSQDSKWRQSIQLLNSVGPAAATEAVAYALQHNRAKLTQNYSATDFVTNMRVIRNEVGDGFNGFNNTLRQFLLPRYSYIDFDAIVDPRHRIDSECGYPKFITPIMYRYMYDRDDVASRVVDIFPDECAAVEMNVYEDEDEDTLTPFEEDYQNLVENHNLEQMLYRMDKLCGIGHYGTLLIGIDDGKELDQPVDGIDLWGNSDPTYKGPGWDGRQLLYMRPFDEYLSYIMQYDTNVNSPRYGLPVMYNLVFLDMTIDAAGASVGTRLNRRVHWTRLCHIIDNPQASRVFGVPRQQQVFNRLLDLRKIKGGSAEMLWKGGFPGIAFEIDPQFVADDPEFDRDAFKQSIENYANGLQRYLDLVGIKAKTLNPNVADPKPHVLIQMEAIAANKGIPLRIFLGSEEARLASSQDKLTWNQRLGKHLRLFTEPSLVRNVLNRLIALRVMRPPQVKAGKPGRYFVEWADLHMPTDEDKANLSLKWTQALSQYVASGVIHLIAPMDYLTTIVGLRPTEAKRILLKVESLGGFSKLLKVDPSQGAGVNGTRTNIASGDDSGDASEGRKAKQDTTERKATS